MKKYISVNIVSQALILITAIKKHNCDSSQKINQIKLPYGINRDAAMTFSCQCEWVSINNNEITFTKQGEKIVASFNGVLIDSALWRTILAEYIDKSEPAWAQRIPSGRQEAYLFMNTEEQRCFDEAGLMKSIDPEVVDWWDAIAERIRAKKDASHLDIGREGERCTMLYEQHRTGTMPDWISIDSNVAGYDVLSRRASNSDENILIEAKSSSKPIAEAVCYITRHEWDIAMHKNNINRYFFYIWKLSPGGNMLAILNTAQMQSYIPIDSGGGKWENVSIPYSAFEELFKITTFDE